MHSRFSLLIAIVMAAPCHAGIILTTSPTEWNAEVSDFHTISFSEFPEGTNVTDQYTASHGVTFTDGMDLVDSSPSYVNDGFGLFGLGDIDITFATPQTAIAVDYPGGLAIDLYYRGSLVGSTGSIFPGSGTGAFAGVISSTPFDAVVLRDFWDSFVAIDDLHFGIAAIPVPGAWVALLLTAVVGTRRRRCGT